MGRTSVTVDIAVEVERGSEVLQVTEVAQYEDLQNIVREGEQGEQLYIVLTGQVEVMRTGAPVARIDPGEHFGEMALIRNQPRSASARAVSNFEPTPPASRSGGSCGLRRISSLITRTTRSSALVCA